MVDAAEGDELPEVEVVGIAGESSVATEEAGQRQLLRIGPLRVIDDDRSVVMASSKSGDSGARRPGPSLMKDSP